MNWLQGFSLNFFYQELLPGAWILSLIATASKNFILYLHATNNIKPSKMFTIKSTSFVIISWSTFRDGKTFTIHGPNRDHSRPSRATTFSAKGVVGAEGGTVDIEYRVPTTPRRGRFLLFFDILFQCFFMIFFYFLYLFWFCIFPILYFSFFFGDLGS